MSFDINYPNRKDWRKRYYKSKAFDKSCRCHGGCPYCESNRSHKNVVRDAKLDEDVKDFKKNDEEKFGESENNS